MWQPKHIQAQINISECYSEMTTTTHAHNNKNTKKQKIQQ